MLAPWDSIPTASVTIGDLVIQHHKEESNEMYDDKENASNQVLSKIQKLEG
jgi:hypothetical protein